MTIERQSPDTMRMLADAGWDGVVRYLLGNVNRVESLWHAVCATFFWPSFARMPIAYARDVVMPVSPEGMSKMSSQPGNKSGRRQLL
jgi:hypothetical protein